MRLSTCSSNQANGLVRFGSRLVEVDGDCHSLRAERNSERAAHAMASAGYECNASLELHAGCGFMRLPRWRVGLR
jgi:hypothetical protein